MKYPVKTTKAQQFIDITSLVNKAVSEKGIKNGLAVLFVPHTTAGITINENADPDVVKDILKTLNKTYPEQDGYLHAEGNSHAHIKASLMGSSSHIIIKNGKLVL
jgi:secondary thiamine-phosphate synthase enzyme